VAPGSPGTGRGAHWPTGASRIVGVMGDPIAHSLSPQLHNAAFDAMGVDWVSVAFPVPAGRGADALGAMRALGIAGLSVTMPHKGDACAAVDEMSDVARRLGAVNCVTRRGEVLVGDSTDGAGLLESLRRACGFDPGGRRCLVVGAGGAARAVVLALADAGASEVVVVNRTSERARQAAALAGGVGRVGSAADVGEAELVVQATSVGMARPGGEGGADGAGGALPVDAAGLHGGQVVVDLVYHPLRTPLLRVAAERGAQAVSGLGMLVHQAARALEIWTGEAVPVEAMWAAAERLTAPSP